MRCLLLLLTLMLAACQPLPRPFAGDRPPTLAPALSPPDSAGVTVEPVAGAPSPLDAQLAEAMAAALRDAEIPASTQGRNKRSYLLVGTAQERPLDRGRSAVTIDWELRDARNQPLARRSQAFERPSASWREGGEELAKEAVSETAPALAKLIQGEAPASAATGVADPVVAVRPVAGAPGDGQNSLTRAMGDALRRAKLTVASEPGQKEAYVVVGTVTMSPAKAGKQQVKVTWSLRRLDGSQIGQVSQENAVPAGSLDGAWGDIAYVVASAAADGIAALIERLKAEQVHS